MSVDIELKGTEDIIKALENLGRKAKSIEEPALNKGGNLILAEAKNNLDSVADERTGKLKEHLSISKIKGKVGRKYILVGIQKGDISIIFYGKFLEWGAVPHTIKLKKGKVAGRIINHPGIAPRPYLGPAYESKKNEAKKVIANELRKGLGL